MQEKLKQQKLEMAHIKATYIGKVLTTSAQDPKAGEIKPSYIGDA